MGSHIDAMLDGIKDEIRDPFEGLNSNVLNALRLKGDEAFKELIRSAYGVEKQVGGSHYSNRTIQPIHYIQANNLPYEEGNIIKYVTRHKDKNGLEDIKKAIQYLEFIIERDYNEKQ